MSACAPLLLARYYVLTTASIAAGLWDWLRHGTPAGWEPAGGHALMARRAFDVVVAGVGAARARRRSCSLAVARDPPRVARQRDLPPAPRRARTARAFDLLKLRTMVTGAEHIGAGLAVDEGDTRITRVGALLRRTSLDELPNLVNVLRGEMAIVGPRPTVPVQVDHYTERQRGRLAVKPGHHRLGAGQRPRRAAVGRAHRARPLVHRAPLLAPRPADPAGARVRMVLGGDGLYRGEAPAWRDPPSDS